MAEEAIAKARAIAARLAGIHSRIYIDAWYQSEYLSVGVSGGGSGGSTELGKRKNRWDDDSGAGGGHHGCENVDIDIIHISYAFYLKTW